MNGVLIELARAVLSADYVRCLGCGARQDERDCGCPAGTENALDRDALYEGVTAIMRKHHLLIKRVAKKEIDDAHYLIYSFEHEAWWRPRRRGYTSQVDYAGVYEAQEAIDICSAYVAGNDRQEIMVPADVAHAIVAAERWLRKEEALDRFVCARNFDLESALEDQITE